MSQAGDISAVSGPVPPQVPTSFVEDVGIAVAVANILNVVGGTGIDTSGAGNTVTITFDGSEVPTLPTSFTTDNATVAVPAANNINFLTTVAAAGTTPFQSTGAGSTVTHTIQRAQAAAASAANIVGLASFDSGDFDVDANGFVTLDATVGQTITGDSGGALSPTAGNWNILGQQASTIAVMDTIGSGSTLRIEDRTYLTAFVVDPSTTNGLRGTFSTVQAAITAASAGTTVFIRSGTYTEDLTLKAGVNLQGFDSADPNNSTIIIGNATATFAGSCSIAGVTLRTNSAPFLTVSGSAATIVNLEACYLDCLNNTGISHTAANVASKIVIGGCDGNIATTGITFFVSTSTGPINAFNCTITNTGAATTATSVSASNAEFHDCDIYFPLSTSSTGSFTNYNTNIITTPINTASLTTAGTGISSQNLCGLQGGTASAVSIGVGSTVALNQCDINSSNTNAITGAGSLQSTLITFSGTSSVINPTTQTFTYSQLGKYKASAQPAFSAYLPSALTDVTGDGTQVKLGTGTALTEVFDQGGDFNTNGTFTAPVTGRYQFNAMALLQGVGATNTSTLQIQTTARNYTFGNFGTSAIGNMPLALSVLADMTAGDTASVFVDAGNGAKTVDIYGAADFRTGFSGYLVA